MKNCQRFINKNVLVLGLAKSGFAAGSLLHKLGANVTVNDAKPFEENERAKELQEMGISVICGAHPISLLDEPIDFIVKNPGIPYTNPILQKAMQIDVPIITEIELASILSEAELIAITGSNGKTTTTTLIVEMLRNSGREPLVAGNIGTVASEVVQQATTDNIIVTEVSSFQLVGTNEFHPKVAVLLNLFDAHLDFHGTKQEYGLAKQRIFKNLTEDDFFVINRDDSDVVHLAKDTKGTEIPFSVSKIVDNGAYLKDGSIYFKQEAIISVDEIVLPGKHNLENILAAIGAAKVMGAKTSQIVNVLKTFQGVPHRLQFVTEISGRRFYNDSKATNILATETAIQAFNDDIILIAGGLDRGNDFDALIPSLKKVKALITYGQTAEKLVSAAKKAGISIIKRVHTLDQAVPVAYEYSDDGDVILLSPACASWDQYKTFEQRGDMFIKSVHKLK